MRGIGVRMKKKTGNTGFSLVELIVVVLIIAVIAVALAPQVIKWVDKARTNVQENDMGSIKTCFDVSVAEYLAKGGTLSSDAVYYIHNSKLYDSSDHEIVIASTTDELAKLVDETMASDYPEVMKPNGNRFKITVKQDLHSVTVELVN